MAHGRRLCAHLSCCPALLAHLGTFFWFFLYKKNRDTHVMSRLQQGNREQGPWRQTKSRFSPGNVFQGDTARRDVGALRLDVDTVKQVHEPARARGEAGVGREAGKAGPWLVGCCETGA